MKSNDKNSLTMRIQHTIPEEFRVIAPLLRPAIEKSWELLSEEERNPDMLTQRLFSICIAEIQAFINEQK